jgi:hypothetical protein
VLRCPRRPDNCLKIDRFVEGRSSTSSWFGWHTTWESTNKLVANPELQKRRGRSIGPNDSCNRPHTVAGESHHGAGGASDYVGVDLRKFTFKRISFSLHSHSNVLCGSFLPAALLCHSALHAISLCLCLYSYIEYIVHTCVACT